MTLAESLTAHYLDAASLLDDGLVSVNGEAVFSAHVELNAGDEVEIDCELLKTWTIQ